MALRIVSQPGAAPQTLTVQGGQTQITYSGPSGRDPKTVTGGVEQITFGAS